MRPFFLSRCILGVTAFLFSIASSRADSPGPDPAVDLAALKDAGGTVTETAGVVTKLSFKDCSKLTEVDFARIGRLKQLKSLTLFGRCAGLTDTTLPLLTNLTQLEELSTEGIQVSDAGLKSFASLTNLRSLAFFHLSLQLKGFTGAGFAALTPLTKLERLTIAGTAFNDEGMAAIGQLTSLREFRTWHTYQTAAGTPSLLKLINLRTLRFGQRLRKWDGSPNLLTLDDSTLGTFAKLSSLESLGLDEARLTYAGMAQLKSLPKLKTLTLEHVDVPAADIEHLRADLPNVTITWKAMEPAEVTKLEAALKH